MLWEKVIAELGAEKSMLALLASCAQRKTRKAVDLWP
jgi:hypothetical protein